MRFLRRVAVVLVVVAMLVLLGWWSGRQPDRDAVAVARRDLGIDLEARVVDVGDVSLFVVLAGPAEGPPVVLLHGFPEFWYAWSRPMAVLAAAGFRVAVPDQRGYGHSDKPADVAAYRLDHLSDDVAGLIGTLGWQRANVAGHDWGGAVAWTAAIRHPDRVSRLAIIDTPHPRAFGSVRSDAQTISWFRTFFQVPWLPEWSSRVGNWFLVARMLRTTALPGAFPDEKMDLLRSAWDHDGAYSTMVNWYRAAFRSGAPPDGDMQVHVPTLVLLAPTDAFMAGETTRASLRWVDDGRIVELPRGTHWVLQEDPEAVARELARFFTR
jgi:epoxide hydrolase 4